MAGTPPPARFVVTIARAAAADLRAIATYLAENHAPATATDFLATMLDHIATLETFPLRGPVPKELRQSGREGYRQMLHGRYRIIYRVREDHVTVVLVADGRRDMHALLRDRLLATPPPPPT